MAQQTNADDGNESEIKSVGIDNGDLIDVLTTTLTYERTDGARQENPLLAVIGPGKRKMLVKADEDVVADEIVLPEQYAQATIYDTVHGTSLVGKGELMDTISVCGQDADLQVL